MQRGLFRLTAGGPPLRWEYKTEGAPSFCGFLRKCGRPRFIPKQNSANEKLKLRAPCGVSDFVFPIAGCHPFAKYAKGWGTRQLVRVSRCNTSARSALLKV